VLRQFESVDVGVVREDMRFAVCRARRHVVAVASPLVLACVTFAASPAARAADDAVPAGAASGESIDDEAFARLLAALRTGESFRVRSTAAVALGRLGDPRALPALQDALRGDGSYAVRSAACAALGRIGDPIALPLLVEALGDKDEYVHAAAEEALGRFHTPRLLFSFRELLGSSDERARRAAVMAYGEVMRSPDASPGLAVFVVNALADDSESVALAAEAGLAGLPHERVLPLLLDGLRAGDSGVKAGCARLLEKRIDLRAVEPLIALIVDAESTVDVRAAARRALAKHVEYLDVASFAAAAAGSSVPERVRAVRVLAALGDARAAAQVERALSDVDPVVRIAGARAAADLGGPKARASLEAATARELDARQKRQLELILKSMAR
jgi:HEAT repeat protein